MPDSCSSLKADSWQVSWKASFLWTALLAVVSDLADETGFVFKGFLWNPSWEKHQLSKSRRKRNKLVIFQKPSVYQRKFAHRLLSCCKCMYTLTHTPVIFTQPFANVTHHVKPRIELQSGVCGKGSYSTLVELPYLYGSVKLNIWNISL